MNHLIDFGVYALVGFTNDIILHNYLTLNNTQIGIRYVNNYDKNRYL